MSGEGQRLRATGALALWRLHEAREWHWVDAASAEPRWIVPTRGGDVVAVVDADEGERDG